MEKAEELLSDGRPADKIKRKKKRKIGILKTAECNIGVFQLVLRVKTLDLNYIYLS